MQCREDDHGVLIAALSGRAAFRLVVLPPLASRLSVWSRANLALWYSAGEIWPCLRCTSILLAAEFCSLYPMARPSQKLPP
jgi:hypothetical protein